MAIFVVTISFWQQPWPTGYGVCREISCALDVQVGIMLRSLCTGKKRIDFQIGGKCIFASHFIVCLLK